MKNIKLLFYAFSILFILSSCKNNDDENPTINIDNIVGNWKIVDFNGNSTSTITTQGVDSIITEVQEGHSYNAFIEISENPKEFLSTGSFTNNITSTNQDQIIEQNFDVPAIGINGTWRIDGKLFVTTNQGQTKSDTHTILELSTNTLIIRTKIEEEITKNGVTRITQTETFQTFEKQ